jgi:hypothetical protein
MSSEIIESVAYENYDDFQHVNFIFSQNFISLFWGLFNDETDKVRYVSSLIFEDCHDAIPCYLKKHTQEQRLPKALFPGN